MIRITIDLIPFGIESEKSTIGIAEIWNTMTGTKTFGNYGYRIFEKHSRTIWKSGCIKRFPRKRRLGWDLLYRVLRDCLGERNE